VTRTFFFEIFFSQGGGSPAEKIFVVAENDIDKKLLQQLGIGTFLFASVFFRFWQRCISLVVVTQVTLLCWSMFMEK